MLHVFDTKVNNPAFSRYTDGSRLVRFAPRCFAYVVSWIGSKTSSEPIWCDRYIM